MHVAALRDYEHLIKSNSGYETTVVSRRTCSTFPFLAAFFALAPLLLAAVSPVSGLVADGETEVMMVGCTIHCKSGLVEIAVTVGTNGATGASRSGPGPCVQCSSEAAH